MCPAVHQRNAPGKILLTCDRYLMDNTVCKIAPWPPRITRVARGCKLVRAYGVFTEDGLWAIQTKGRGGTFTQEEACAAQATFVLKRGRAARTATASWSCCAWLSAMAACAQRVSGHCMFLLVKSLLKPGPTSPSFKGLARLQ